MKGHSPCARGGQHLPLTYLVVMRWQLIEELSNPVLLSRAVHIWHLFLWQTGEIHLDLWTHLEDCKRQRLADLSVVLDCTLVVEVER